MVGVSLALQLGAVLPEEISILLVESFPFPEPVAETESGAVPQYHPSFDARSTALSYSSRVIYERMQVWDTLQQWLCPIEKIHVSTLGRFGSTLLQAHDHNWEALGYVAENAWLGSALVQALYQQGRVSIVSPASVEGSAPLENGLQLSLSGGNDNVETSLLLVADGAGSKLREQLGMGVTEKAYEQHALVANIATHQAHGSCAFERFTDEGPLALLPLLPGPSGEHRSSLVWTLAPAQAAHLQACSEEEFLRTLQARFGYRLGRMLHAGERTAYPLALVQSTEQVRANVVVMGNAAHALHPVAGQGFNLALRDVAQLADTLRVGLSEGKSVGGLSVLEQYQKKQSADQAKTIAFSDRVPALFMHADPVLGLGRDLALAGMDILPPLKREFVRHAAGMAGVNV